MYKKGTVLVRDMSGAADTAGSAKETGELSKRQKQREQKKRQKAEIVQLHVDLIRDEFWTKYPFLLA